MAARVQSLRRLVGGPLHHGAFRKKDELPLSDVEPGDTANVRNKRYRWQSTQPAPGSFAWVRLGGSYPLDL